jgi:FAD synthetase
LLFRYTSIGSTHNTFPNPCLRRTPSTTNPSSPSSSSSSSPRIPGTTTTTDSASIDQSVGSWLPAWELKDGSQERAGREVSLKQVQDKVGELRLASRSRSQSRERTDENRNGKGEEGTRIEGDGSRCEKGEEL